MQSVATARHRSPPQRWCWLALIGAAACESQAPPGPAILSSSQCCGGRGHCIAESYVDKRYASMLAHQECSAISVCVPDEFQGLRQLPTCQVAATGAEGRCLPDCLPQIAEQGARLAQDGCAEHQRCAPCYDPVSGNATGVCSFGRDPGPSAPPTVFRSCCGGLGRCAASQLVAAEQRVQLGRDSCTGSDQLCVPAAIVTDPDYKPARCTSSLGGAEGRCLPGCLPALAAQRARLARDSCADGEVCAPCFDPVSGQATGSCSVGADPGPQQPPVVFESCCGNLGRCVPGELASSEERMRLGRDTCSAGATLCAPVSFLDAQFAPQTCVAEPLRAEGRCLPRCLPEIASQTTRLAQASCPIDHLCAPCNDPFTGRATGACAVGQDTGPTQPGRVLAKCCSDLGRCVPQAAVPDAQRAQLGQDVCESTGEICVPEALAKDAQARPDACTIPGLGSEGRCLPNCLPAVQARAGALTQESCVSLHSCVPCFDPLTGQSTGACQIGGDRGPDGPPVTLAECCGGLGRCAPAARIPEAYASNFGRDTCIGEDLRCVAPAEALSNAEAFRPLTCRDAITRAEGRCLPACLPSVAQRAAALGQNGCPERQLCVPCFEPLSGEPSGACTLGSDPGPTEPAVIFKSCCQDGSGVCIPAQLAPPTGAALPVDTCTPSAELCAPRQLTADPQAKLTSCTSLITSKGVCMSTCFLPALTLTGSCPTGQACAPCDQLSGIGGC